MVQRLHVSNWFSWSRASELHYTQIRYCCDSAAQPWLSVHVTVLTYKQRYFTRNMFIAATCTFVLKYAFSGEWHLWIRNSKIPKFTLKLQNQNVHRNVSSLCEHYPSLHWWPYALYAPNICISVCWQKHLALLHLFVWLGHLSVCF